MVNFAGSIPASAQTKKPSIKLSCLKWKAVIGYMEISYDLKRITGILKQLAKNTFNALGHRSYLLKFLL